MKLNNIILISGSGRNVGKTTLACNIIKTLSTDNDVVGLKISPHFHKTSELQKLISEGESFKVFQEFDSKQEKDSSRMLNAGAKEVFFIQCSDQEIEKAVQSLQNILTSKSPIVCESGSLAKSIDIGIHLLVKGINPDETKLSYRKNLEKADYIISPLDFNNDNIFFNLEYDGKNWKIENL
ncbi:MAG: hypothetical protein C0598_00265 [Marinilabiliales bacterium]|nr:MAG: hypothetical protein C0598_00265 [Marinilabiliales bacterium]